MFTIVQGPIIFGSLLTVFGLIAIVALILMYWPALEASVLGDDTAERSSAMDGLRGILALNVFVYHAVLSRRYFGGQIWGSPPGHFLTLLGHVSVALFFMISAYLFWGRIIAKGGSLNWMQFYRGRALRLMPLYYTAVVLLLIIVTFLSPSLQVPISTLCQQIIHWLIFNLLGRSDINQQPASIILGVAWTLKYEWIFYFALPVLAYFYRKTGHRTWPIAVAIILFSLNSKTVSMYAYFALGFIAVHLVEHPWTTRYKYRVAIMAVLMLCVLGTGFSDLRGKPLALFPILVISVASIQSTGPWAILLSRPLRFLGHISYSVYLLHVPILYACVKWLIGPQLFSTLPDTAFYLVCLSLGLLIVGISILTFLGIEKPFLARPNKVAVIK